MDGLWLVVGGADKGGIVVREGQDTASPLLPERLSTLALLRQRALEGERLHFELLHGTGPATGWVSLRLQSGKELVVDGSKVWEVVGGEGKDLSSTAIGERLSTGAHVKQLELEGERLRFERLSGTGPETGWVGLRLTTGKELVLPAFRNFGAPTEPEPQVVVGEPLELLMSNEERGFSFEGLPAWVPKAAAVAKLRREGRPYVPTPEEQPERLARLRPHYEVAYLNPHKPTPLKKLREKTLLTLPGICFGMTFPYTAGLIDSEEFGAAWLTKAFHASGALPEDNEVVRITRCEELPTSGMDCAGGAGKKAFVTVEYKKPDPELHTELFAKYPYEFDFFPSQRHFLSGQQFDNDGQEVFANLYCSHLFPFRAPKVYFADISRESTNWILFTETIPYGKRGKIVEGKIVEQKEFQPYEIMPSCGKYQDYLLSDPVEIYCCIFKAMGMMAAWDKLGRYDSYFGPAPVFNEAQFLASTRRDPQTRATLNMTVKATETMADKAIDFVLSVAPQLFCEEVRDAGRLAKMKEELVAMCPNFFDMQRHYQTNHTDFIAAMHVNLQADNAYFWRDECGDLSCGVLDWGGFGRSPYCGNFLGCLGGMHPDLLLEHLPRIIQCFADEYHRCGGPKVASEELLLRYHLNFIVSVFDSFQWLERSVYKQTKREDFRTMKSLQDETFQDTWETRCRVSGLVYSTTYYIKRGNLKATFDEWAKGKGAPYLQVYQ